MKRDVFSVRGIGLGLRIMVRLFTQDIYPFYVRSAGDTVSFVGDKYRAHGVGWTSITVQLCKENGKKVKRSLTIEYKLQT